MQNFITLYVKRYYLAMPTQYFPRPDCGHSFFSQSKVEFQSLVVTIAQKVHGITTRVLRKLFFKYYVLFLSCG